VRTHRGRLALVDAPAQQNDDERRIKLEELACGVEAARPRQRHHDELDTLERGERARFLLVVHLADDLHVRT
jgi:hypothetical protein